MMPPTASTDDSQIAAPLTAALRYAARGFHVFPVHSVRRDRCSCGNAKCKKAAKHPRTRNGFKDATIDPKAIEEWWTTWPDANVGIATGRVSGIFAVDLDAKNDGPGKFEAVVQAHGDDQGEPLIQQTGGGGNHLVYRYPDGRNISSRQDLHGLGGIDVKADGGYIIAAPSVHASGKPYVWVDDAMDCELSDAPDWIIDLVCDVSPSANGKATSAERDQAFQALVAAGLLKPVTIAELESALAHIDSDPRDTWLRVGFALHDAIGKGLTEAQAYDLWTEWSKRSAKFDAVDQAKTWRGFGKSKRAPNAPRTTVGTVFFLARQNGWRGAHRTPSARSHDDGTQAQSAPPMPWTTELDPLGRTDMANARRLSEKFGEDLLYATGRGWFVWDGNHFRHDDSDRILHYARRAVESIKEEALHVNGKMLQELIGWYLQSRNKLRIDAMVSLARSEERLRIDGRRLDADAWLLNVRNGTIDLRTGELRPHRREDLITKLVPIDFDPAATCPRWEQFMIEVFSDAHGKPRLQLANYVQRALGYTLTGLTSERVVFFLFGEGRNGKSILLEIVRFILGDYARSTSFATFLEMKHESARDFQLAMLPGARFVTAVEPNPTAGFAESIIKALTGGDTITACFKFKDHFEYRPVLKAWLAANHQPAIRGTDAAIWDRLHVIPFDRRWKKRGETSDLPEEDLDLLQKQQAEAPGILAWMVRGCLEWQRTGLCAPPEVTNGVARYRAGMSDLFDSFMAACIDIVPNVETSFADIWDAYTGFVAGQVCQPLGRKNLSKRLDRAGFRRTRNSDRGFTGIAIKGDWRAW